MNDKNIEEIVNCVYKVINEIDNKEKSIDKIMVEGSGRHVHLSESDAISLFGTKDLVIVKELSQPGQYVSNKKVSLIGPKGMLNNVTVLGPCRDKTQVELSLTDVRQIGLKAPISESGDLEKATDIIIYANEKTIKANQSVIVAKRHIHMTTNDALKLNVKDKDCVMVKVMGGRNLTFDEVVVRVNDNYKLSMHIDYDEANAVGLNKHSYGQIVTA